MDQLLDPPKFSCVRCRDSKLKCDRLWPQCTRCAKALVVCDYPTSKLPPHNKRKRTENDELVDFQSLEPQGHAFDFSNDGLFLDSNYAADPVDESYQSCFDLVSTGLNEGLPPADMMEDL